MHLIIMQNENDKLLDVLRTIVDPEVGINIVDLGLVYSLKRDELGVTVDLTMTSPACPMGESIMAEVEYELAAALPPDATVAINLVWQPPWCASLMSERARSTLGWEI